MSVLTGKYSVCLSWDGDNFSTVMNPQKKSTITYDTYPYSSTLTTELYPSSATVVDIDWGRYYDVQNSLTRSITKADVLSANFGVAFLPLGNAQLDTRTYGIDYVAVKISWSDGGGVRGVGGVGSNADFKCYGNISCDGYILGKSGVDSSDNVSASMNINAYESVNIVEGDLYMGSGAYAAPRIRIPYTNEAAGSTGNKTINKISGRVRVAAAGTSVTVTNDRVTADSHIVATCSTNDTTAYIKNVVPGAGTFTINLGAAATAETAIDWVVFN